jgi:hypothetical protein
MSELILRMATIHFVDGQSFSFWLIPELDYSRHDYIHAWKNIYDSDKLNFPEAVSSVGIFTYNITMINWHKYTTSISKYEFLS